MRNTILKTRREERAALHRRRTRELGLLESSHRRTRGDQLHQNIITTALLPQTTNIPREERQGSTHKEHKKAPGGKISQNKLNIVTEQHMRAYKLHRPPLDRDPNHKTAASKGRQQLQRLCNEYGTIYAISSDFGDRMTTQSMGLMVLLSEHF